MENAVTVNPRIMYGTPCFAGTRVPVSTLFDWIEEGQTIDYFLEEFPTVTREQAVAVIEAAKRRTVSEAITGK